MEIVHVNLLFYAIFVVAGVNAIMATRRKDKRHFNPFNKAFINLILALMVFASLRFLIPYVLENIVGIDEPVIGVSLKISHISGFAMQATMLTFLLYIYKKVRFYHAPWVWMFFLTLGMIQYDGVLASTISSIILSTSLLVFLFYKGVSNHDGRVFAFGLFVLATTIGDFLVYSPILDLPYAYLIVGNMVGFILLNLGTSDFLDRHVLYDRKKEQAIKNTWIATMMKMDARGRPVPLQRHIEITGKRVMVECPVCHVKALQYFSEDVVRKRRENPKGIVRIMIHEEKLCEHSFMIYVDRDFAVRGYETVDIFT